MGIILKPEDIEPFADIPREKLEAMIADVEAVAVSVAPCIAKPDFKYKDAAKAILRRALLRWNDTGVSGQVQYESGARLLRLHGRILPRICFGLLRLLR